VFLKKSLVGFSVGRFMVGGSRERALAVENDEFAGWTPEMTIRVVVGEANTRVFVQGQLYMSWSSGDKACVRLAIVQLYDCGLGTQEELAEAFGMHVNSVQRYITDFASDGVRGLLSDRSGPKRRWKLTAAVRGKILLIVLRDGIWKLDAIQQRLVEAWREEVSVPSIQQVLEENGLSEPAVRGVSEPEAQAELFSLEPDRQLNLSLNGGGGQAVESSERTSEPEASRDLGKANALGGGGGVSAPDAGYRRNYSVAQRVYLDQLEQGDYNAYAGGLLLAPLLARYDFLSILRRTIAIPTYEGFSLDELALTLFYLDVFGFRSMEDFKRAYPEEFGVLVGRSQSPSLFTLRRFLHKVRKLGKGEALIDEFAVSYLKSGLAQWGVMYIDGHFMPYYGVHPISKGWHGVRQIPMKGSYNFLAVDERFSPWLFLIRSSAEDLLEKIPELIEKAKRLGEKAGVSREQLDQLIVLFDREGYSAELYRYLDGRDQGEGKRRALFISWAKYADKWVNDFSETAFDQVVRVTYQIQEAKDIHYLETTRSMSKYGKIRAVVIQSGEAKQRAAIYTNGTSNEIGAPRLVQLICHRWGEENAIKELLHKHLINYTPGYLSEELEKQPRVDNPKVTELKKKRAGLVSELNRLKIELADHMLQRPGEKRKPPPRSQAEVLESIAVAKSAILLTDQQLDPLPREISFAEAHDGEKLQQLDYEKKRFLDGIKVFVYNLKAEMCRLLLQHYDRQKELLPALSMIVERAGYVKLEGGRLRVTLRRFKDREIDYAARHLCEDLNRMQPVTLDRFHFPIHYQVQ
jgi:transposase